MENVLLVDDEQPFLLSLKDGLISYSSGLNILCAAKGGTYAVGHVAQ